MTSLNMHETFTFCQQFDDIYNRPDNIEFYVVLLQHRQITRSHRALSDSFAADLGLMNQRLLYYEQISSIICTLN